MADTVRYTLEKPARTLYASIHEASSATLESGQKTEPRFGATFGLEEVDFKAIVAIMVDCIKAEFNGVFTAPNDYYLSCMGGVTAGKRAIEAATFKCSKPGLTEDQKFKIMEKAEKRAELYKPFAGILIANSKFKVEMAYLERGTIKDVPDEAHAIAKAGKDYFYPGAFVVPAVGFKAFRRKTMEAKDGVTSYLQNCLYVRKGERLGGSGGPANSEVFGKYAGYSDYDPTAMAPGASGDADQPEF